MQFKEEKLQDELAHTPAMLQVMAEWFCHLSIAHFSIDPIVTRVFEAVHGSSGVHEIGHAVDFRCEHNGVFLYSPEQQRFLESEMNRRFLRKDGKKSFFFHSFCGGALHGHLQVNLTSTVDNGVDGNNVSKGDTNG